MTSEYQPQAGLCHLSVPIGSAKANRNNKKALEGVQPSEELPQVIPRIVWSENAF